MGEYVDRLKTQMKQEVLTGTELAIAEAVLELAGEDPKQVSPEAKEAYAQQARDVVGAAKLAGKTGEADGFGAEVVGPDGETTELTEKPTLRGPAVGDGTNRRGEDPVYERPGDPEDDPALQNAKRAARAAQGTDGDDETLDSLKHRASELEIEGRSSMNKEQLQQAIADAEAE